MNYIHSIYSGIGLGLLLGFSFGPGFFSLLQISITQGFRSGAFLALGIFFSDICCVLLAYLGVSQLLANPESTYYIKLIGGVLLLLFGTYNFFKKPKVYTEGENVKISNPYVLGVQGFFTNLINPVVILSWFGFISAKSSSLEDDPDKKAKLIVFLFITLATVLSSDLLKAFLAQKVKQFFTFQRMQLVNRLVGITLFCIGLVMLYKLFGAPIKL